jgi:UDP-2,3-diacylglucosamine pyrophosphatase LpxH
MTLHYVISDLHLGMGRVADQGWHPLEDFKSDASFKKFLDRLEDDGVDELIINGDWIDFTQLEPLAYRPGILSADGHNLGWTEDESLEKLKACISAHKGFFDDLRSFLRDGKKLTIIMGNHDPDLFWPKVSAEVRSLLRPPHAEQLEMVRTYVRRGTAHIEHGNQHCSPENKFFNPNNVFHDDTEGEQRIELVWGSIFVMEFFNPIEYELPYADNIKTQSRAIWLGIKNGWVNGRMAAKFVKFLWGAGIPWGSITANVLSVKRRPTDLIRDLTDREIAQDLMGRYVEDDRFREDFNKEIAQTSAEEWRAINAINEKGEHRQQLVTSDELTPATEREETATLGAFRDNPEIRGAESLMSIDVKYIIFGHTHTEIDGAHSDARLKNYFNTGSWVNSMDLSLRENRARLKNISKDDLKDDELFELRLRAAAIEVGDNRRTHVSLREVEI